MGDDYSGIVTSDYKFPEFNELSALRAENELLRLYNKTASDKIAWLTSLLIKKDSGIEHLE